MNTLLLTDGNVTLTPATPAFQYDATTGKGQFSDGVEFEIFPHPSEKSSSYLLQIVGACGISEHASEAITIAHAQKLDK